MTRAHTLATVVSVLSERWVLTLATHDPEAPRQPYPTPLFYALVEDTATLGLETRRSAELSRGPGLIFLSDPKTMHGRHLDAGPTPVAGAVYLETEEVSQIRGVQLRGRVWREDALDRERPGPRSVLTGPYLLRHPVANKSLVGEKPPCLYLLAIDWAKVTDNRLGFGHHAQWQRNERASEG